MTDKDVDRIAVAVETRLAPRFERLETDIRGLKAGLEDVRSDIAGLRDHLVGVIDERFPAIL